MADWPWCRQRRRRPSDMDLPLSSLVAGDYLIQIDASGDGGAAQELIGFRITG